MREGYDFGPQRSLWNRACLAMMNLECRKNPTNPAPRPQIDWAEKTALWPGAVCPVRGFRRRFSGVARV